MKKIFSIGKLYLFFFLFVICLTVAGIFLYYQNLQSSLSSASCQSLEETLAQQTFNIKQELETDFDYLKNTAKILSELSYENKSAQLLSTFKNLAVTSNFNSFILADTEGVGITTIGGTIDIFDRMYFKAAIDGYSTISEPLVSKASGNTIINFASPISGKDGVSMVLVGSLLTERLKSLLLPSYGEMGYAYVITNTGDIITQTKSPYAFAQGGNLFDTWKEKGAKIYRNDDMTTIISNVQQGIKGHFGIDIGGQRRLCHYGPLGVKDWSVFVVVPQEVIAKNANEITAKTILFIGVIIAVISFFLIFNILSQIENEKLREQHLAQLTKIAYIDELTGEGNFNRFREDAQRILEEHPQERYCIVKLDISNFKLFNKLYGFSEGNRLLISFSNALKSILSEKGEVFARLNVDEFVLLRRYDSAASQEESRQKFISNVYKEMAKDFNYKLIVPTGQYITTQIDNEKANISELFEKANFAHRHAKLEKTNFIVDYDEKITSEALINKDIENRMEKALQSREFLIYLQPKYELETETIGGVEALVRWDCGDKALFFPNAFIPIFEDNGFITKFDFYMLELACDTIKNWIADGYEPVIISVNFSRAHLENENLVRQITQVVDRVGVPHRCIEIELTETAMYENLEAIERMQRQLKEGGFTLSMDDFGCGYSSLGLLKNLEVDVIKIDRSFFVDQKNEARSRVVVANVIRMAKELGINTVAEGVEEQKHIDMLKELGCDMVQGYFYSKPKPVSEITLQKR